MHLCSTTSPNPFFSSFFEMSRESFRASISSVSQPDLSDSIFSFFSSHRSRSNVIASFTCRSLAPVLSRNLRRPHLCSILADLEDLVLRAALLAPENLSDEGVCRDRYLGIALCA